MTKIYNIAFAVILALIVTGCRKNDSETPKDIPLAIEYYVSNIKPSHTLEGLTFLNVDSYQQTTEYTCGLRSDESSFGSVRLLLRSGASSFTSVRLSKIVVFCYMK